MQDDGKPKVDTVIDDCLRKLAIFKDEGKLLGDIFRETHQVIDQLNKQLDRFIFVIKTGDGGGQTTTKKREPSPEPSKPGLKFCKECDCEKPLDDFNKKDGAKDGRQYICKKCQSRIQSERYNAKKRIAAKALNDPAPSQSEPVLPSDGDDKGGPTPGQQAPTATTPPVESKPPVNWSKAQDAVLRKNYPELGVSGVYLRNLLPKEYTMTDIKVRCQHLGLMDAFGRQQTRTPDS